jgi:hypothetical protein
MPSITEWRREKNILIRFLRPTARPPRDVFAGMFSKARTCSVETLFSQKSLWIERPGPNRHFGRNVPQPVVPQREIPDFFSPAIVAAGGCANASLRTSQCRPQAPISGRAGYEAPLESVNPSSCARGGTRIDGGQPVAVGMQHRSLDDRPPCRLLTDAAGARSPALFRNACLESFQR